MKEHTKTPWTVKKNQDIEGYYIENNDRAIADLDFGDDQANAQFIVRAVNSHDELMHCLMNAFLYINSTPTTRAGTELAFRIKQALIKDSCAKADE